MRKSFSAICIKHHLRLMARRVRELRKMKKFGIFSGWFSIGGKRGRISFLFSSLFSYLILGIIAYISFIFGLPTFFILALSGNETAIEFSKYLIFFPIGIFVFISLWVVTCIEMQRLRDIGFNGVSIFVTILLTYLIWFLGISSSGNIYSSNSSGFHWSQIILLIFGLFLLLMPPFKEEGKVKPLKSTEKVENKSKINKTYKRIDPTL